MRVISLLRISLLVFFLILSVLQVIAQTNNVGIGTLTPEPSAILDVSNPYNAISGIPSKGMLMPGLTQIQRDLMESQYSNALADGLLIYETDLGSFWYYRHFVPMPATAPFGQWEQLATQQPTSSAMPVGGIIMWSGTNASIPPGWALCDGGNGTPDLTDKFILSVSSGAENPGTAAVPNQFVPVSGTLSGNDRRIFKLAYIIKL